MPNVTKRILEVVEMLKGGKPLDFETYVKTLNCKPVTAMVYISELRVAYNAEIETIRDGRKVVSYRLLNEADLLKTVARYQAAKGIKPTKPASVKPVKMVKAAVAKTKIKDDEFDVPTLDSDLSISEISDREFADLRSQLGL
jgi:hypothetical protein